MADIAFGGVRGSGGSGQAAALSQYKASDSDAVLDPSYYGFLDDDGNWYILKINEALGTYRYKSGSSGYTANWGNRAILEYKTYDEEF